MTSLRDNIEVLSAEDPEPFDAPMEVGGEAVPAPDADNAAAEAMDGGLAAKMRAVGERLQRENTKDFDVPGTPLVLRARSFRDRKAFREGVRTEVFIVRSTAGLFFRDEDTGELTELPTWGTKLADMLGMKVDSASDLVGRVLDNPVRLETFGAELYRWMAGRRADDEQALGE